jgi:hypothetical protein
MLRLRRCRTAVGSERREEVARLWPLVRRMRSLGREIIRRGGSVLRQCSAGVEMSPNPNRGHNWSVPTLTPLQRDPMLLSTIDHLRTRVVDHTAQLYCLGVLCSFSDSASNSLPRDIESQSMYPVLPAFLYTPLQPVFSKGLLSIAARGRLRPPVAYSLI